MLNFTVGPVMSCDEVREIGSEQVPYFRTPEFSNTMIENENLMRKFAGAGEGSRTLFLTASGTGSMEAAVMNLFTERDKVLVVNGGSFGRRFVEICEIHNIPHEQISLSFGQALTAAHLKNYEDKGFTGFLVNVHETSTGVHYDMNLIAEFCRRNKQFLVVDAISSFLADHFNMQEYGAQVMITGSQKALACPPGISVMVLSADAVKRIENNKVKSLYFDLKSALKNGERGQTPFTPAVGILRQINKRLRMIDEAGGAEVEIERVAALAADFRKKIKALPLEMVTSSPSNAVTSLRVREGISADTLFHKIKDQYKIWICPNGGELKHKVFRVGHIGNLTLEDNTTLVECLKEMERKGDL